MWSYQMAILLFFMCFPIMYFTLVFMLQSCVFSITFVFHSRYKRALTLILGQIYAHQFLYFNLLIANVKKVWL